MPYKPSASNNKGRLNPYPVGVASLPRSLRTLLFGASHIEIDLVSAHYQLFQCAALTLLQHPLPKAAELRAALHDDMARPPCTILKYFPQAPKRTPLLLLNSTLGTHCSIWRPTATTPPLKPLPNLLQFLDFEDPNMVGKSAQPHFEALCRMRLGALQLLEPPQ